MKRILLIILLLVSVPTYAVKILRPGDVVKGKKITEKYYCLSEKENLEILKKLDEVKLLQQLVAIKEQRIELLKDTIETMKLRIENKEDTNDRMITEFDRAVEREKTLVKEVQKQHKEIGKQKRRNRRSFTVGGILGAGIAAWLGGKF